MVALVWSERDEPNAPGLRDCTYSAGLELLVHGDFDGFPLGLYSVAEREALERSDDQPDETGASAADLDVAIRRRYGLRLRRPAAGQDLGDLLDRPGLAVAIAGSLGRLPSSSRLRRWQPGFVGGHRLVVVTLGAGRVRWLDPLAPMRYAGDAATSTEALTFAFGDPAELRYTLEGEFAMPQHHLANLRRVPPGSTVTLGQGHSLISQADTRRHFGPYPGPLELQVLLGGDLHGPDERPIDIEGNQPPKNGRHEVWLVDRLGFGVPPYALRADCSPLAAPPLTDDLAARRREYARIAAGARVELPPPPDA